MSSSHVRPDKTEKIVVHPLVKAASSAIRKSKYWAEAKQSWFQQKGKLMECLPVVAEKLQVLEGCHDSLFAHEVAKSLLGCMGKVRTDLPEVFDARKADIAKAVK